MAMRPRRKEDMAWHEGGMEFEVCMCICVAFSVGFGAWMDGIGWDGRIPCIAYTVERQHTQISHGGIMESTLATYALFGTLW